MIKRNRAQDKMMKRMVKELEARLGSYDAGTFLAICLDTLDKLVEGVEQRELRTIEIKINDYFSRKYDFEKMDYVG